MKDKSLSVLIKEADAVFSKYIRQKASINGYCYCFICSKRMKISEAQCGHYRDRDQMATRYDETNCHPLCEYCNCMDLDHACKYEWMMIQVYDLEHVSMLQAKSKGLRKYMRHELKELIDTYKTKLKAL